LAILVFFEIVIVFVNHYNILFAIVTYHFYLYKLLNYSAKKRLCQVLLEYFITFLFAFGKVATVLLHSAQRCIQLRLRYCPVLPECKRRQVNS